MAYLHEYHHHPTVAGSKVGAASVKRHVEFPLLFSCFLSIPNLRIESSSYIYNGPRRSCVPQTFAGLNNRSTTPVLFQPLIPDSRRSYPAPTGAGQHRKVRCTRHRESEKGARFEATGGSHTQEARLFIVEHMPGFNGTYTTESTWASMIP